MSRVDYCRKQVLRCGFEFATQSIMQDETTKNNCEDQSQQIRSRAEWRNGFVRPSHLLLVQIGRARQTTDGLGRGLQIVENPLMLAGGVEAEQELTFFLSGYILDEGE